MGAGPLEAVRGKRDKRRRDDADDDDQFRQPAAGIDRVGVAPGPVVEDENVPEIDLEREPAEVGGGARPGVPAAEQARREQADHGEIVGEHFRAGVGEVEAVALEAQADDGGVDQLGEVPRHGGDGRRASNPAGGPDLGGGKAGGQRAEVQPSKEIEHPEENVGPAPDIVVERAVVAEQAERQVQGEQQHREPGGGVGWGQRGDGAVQPVRQGLEGGLEEVELEESAE